MAFLLPGKMRVGIWELKEDAPEESAVSSNRGLDGLSWQPQCYACGPALIEWKIARLHLQWRERLPTQPTIRYNDIVVKPNREAR